MSDLLSLFQPRTVAVAGASRNPGKIGNLIVKNLIASGFPGAIYPVNPREHEVEGLPCYPDPAGLPQPPDVAVVAVPAALAVAVAEGCARAGAKHLVVVTAGFRETGTDGLRREKELAAVCRQHGARLLGPNCVGLMDTHTPVNASFAGSFPAKGKIAFISQSGAFVLAILDWSFSIGLGFSRFVSLGNKADLNEADMILAAAADEQTRVILCYIEDVAEGRRFMDVAREVSRKKPLIILKSGTSTEGARAASSHTGALAGSDTAYSTCFRQCGVIRAGSMAELFDLALVFATQAIPAGDRVAVVTNSGGPGIVATDRIAQSGLKMARFSTPTIEGLRGSMPAESNIYNPVDVLGDARADRYGKALDLVVSDSNVDALLLLMCPAGVTEPLETARAVVATTGRHPDKPLAAVFMGGPQLASGAELLKKEGVPVFTFPEPAIRALNGLVEYGRIAAAPPSGEPSTCPGTDREAVRRIIDRVRQEGRPVLLGSEAAGVAGAYGIPAVPTRLATTLEDAVQKANVTGYPLVLKVASPKILHKTDVGGVIAGIGDEEGLRKSYVAMMNQVLAHFPHEVIYGVEVQKMMPGGHELIIGATRDLQFGHLIAFGLGGIYTNLLKDVSFRLAYGLTREDIEGMIRETKAYNLVRGYRGQEGGDLAALVDTIARVAYLVTDFPEIADLDINPLFLYPRGLAALDVKITVSTEE